MPASGGWPVTLTSLPGAKAGLTWSPDGRMLAYASQGSIWTVAVAGGPPRRLTHAYAGDGDPRSASDRDPQWSPRGNWIVFATGRRGHNELMVISADGRTESYLGDGDAELANASWAPDGAHIAYTERTPEYFSGKLQVSTFDAATGGVAAPLTLYQAPTDRGGFWMIPRASWSPDSRTLAVVLQLHGWDKVYLIPLAGGGPRELTQGDCEEADPEFAPDGKSLALLSNRILPEARDVWMVSADSSAARPLARFNSPGFDSRPHWAPDGRKIYFARQSPVESEDLLVADAARPTADPAPQYLTRTLPSNLRRAFQEPERVKYRSADGIEIAGMLYRPPHLDPGHRAPAVLWIHGGPEAQSAFIFDLWPQYLAQRGYLVLEPNYRGSTGYGEKFRNLNVEDSGGREVDDVAAGAQFLVDRGWADPARLAIGGGSHGGTMVAYLVTKRPALFHAAIEAWGVVDRAAFVERTNLPSAIHWQMMMGGSPAEKPERYRQANILPDIDKVTAPLLILHGENDPQVPPYESALLVKALRDHRKVYYYFTYPNELHGLTQPEHRLDAWRKQLAFLDKYLRPTLGAGSTSTDDLLLTAPATRSGAEKSP